MARAAVAAAPNRPAYGRRLRPGRSQIALVAVVVVGIWIVAAFAGAINQLSLVAATHTDLAAEAATLDARVAAGNQEVILVQTDGYQALAARAYGIGRPAEIYFALEEGAPAPGHVARLGSGDDMVRGATPLDAWLGLLFGE